MEIDFRKCVCHGMNNENIDWELKIYPPNYFYDKSQYAAPMGLGPFCLQFFNKHVAPTALFHKIDSLETLHIFGAYLFSRRPYIT
jgi:hypothetical protein